MLSLLWLLVAIPFASSAVLAVFGSRLSRKLAAVTGAGSIGVSAILCIWIAVGFLGSPPPGDAFSQVLWRWMDVGAFHPDIGFYLDPLSLLMALVVTFVGFLIHLYSAEFMRDDAGYSRFFAYMNLFVASMLTLVLADNLLLLYLGWEGVGLCSYLLIGFWYHDPINGRAARKAFIVTRVGDTSMALGLFLLFQYLGTLDIQNLVERAAAQWAAGSPLATAVGLLLLGGAVGKSAQLPLQTWLPDAMAGPTPTSALIHAATMVTAGVYLIARTHILFGLAPVAQFAVAVVGAATLLMAGCSALTQTDIKRVLAYSTISQIGYMFLALGVGAWSAALFHFMTHAFFKALLFLGAGVVIESLHEEHDIFRMGGLRRELPVAFWTFLIAGCSLAGLPLVTAGFYSKDHIVWSAWTSAQGGWVFWIVSLAGVLLTSLYTFRLIFLVFFGPLRTPVTRRPGNTMLIPCMVLALLSIVGGFVKEPLLAFLNQVLPPLEGAHAGMTETLSSGFAALAFAVGLYVAYVFYLRDRRLSAAVAASPVGTLLARWWFSDWGMDWLYDRLFVRPVVWIAHAGRHDVLDRIYAGVADLNRLCWRALSFTETGRVRWYAASIAAGTAVLLAVVLFL